MMAKRKGSNPGRIPGLTTRFRRDPDLPKPLEGDIGMLITPSGILVREDEIKDWDQFHENNRI